MLKVIKYKIIVMEIASCIAYIENYTTVWIWS
jgi:hypothetical protein